jgi:hypothetical protein
VLPAQSWAAGVEDAKLKQYLAWVVRQRQAPSDQDGADEDPAEDAAANAHSSSRRHKQAKPSATTKAGKAGKDQQQLQQCEDAPTKQGRTNVAAPQRRTRAQAKAAEARGHVAAPAPVKRGAKHAATTTAKKPVRSSGRRQLRRSGKQLV